MQNGYSHIVIGAGAIGSAAAYWLSRRAGTRVLVLEQFDLVNTESLAGIDAYRRALAAEGIPYEDLTAWEIRSRYPQWRIDDDVTGMYQEAGGLIDIRRSAAAHTSLALAAGVEFLPNTRVEGIDVHPDSVTVRTARGDVEAGSLVVAAASWLPELMADLGLEYRLTLSQEQVSYFTSGNLAEFTPERFPIWIFHGEETFYGFPVYGEPGVKLARDMRGRFISSGERVFEGDDAEAAILRGFLERHLPQAAGPVWANRSASTTWPRTGTSSSTPCPAARTSRCSTAAGTRGSSRASWGRSSPTSRSTAARPTRSSRSPCAAPPSPTPTSSRSSASADPPAPSRSGYGSRRPTHVPGTDLDGDPAIRERLPRG